MPRNNITSIISDLWRSLRHYSRIRVRELTVIGRQRTGLRLGWRRSMIGSTGLLGEGTLLGSRVLEAQLAPNGVAGSAT